MHMEVQVLEGQQGQRGLGGQAVRTQGLQARQENLRDPEDPRWTHLLDPTGSEIKY